jgi:hypothetical protein
MPTQFWDRWQAADRDSLSMELSPPWLTLRPQMQQLLEMDGLDGKNDDAVEERTGRELSRSRRWHKFLERIGVLQYRNNTTRLTKLGKRLQAESGDEPCRRLARAALEVARRYQLKNPDDETNGTYPDDFTIHPYWAVLRAADALEGRLHWDELNRVLMWLKSDAEVDAAIARIASARSQPDYDPVNNGTPSMPLGKRAHDLDAVADGRTVDGQVRDQKTTPWFRRAGCAGLLLESPERDGEGYWRIPDKLRDVVHEAVRRDPPAFRKFESSDAWVAFLDSDEPATGMMPTPPLGLRKPTAIAVADIAASLKAYGLTYTDSVIERFHRGLNYLESKHFVILTGLSGTGKTALARGYARAVHGFESLSGDADPFFFLCAVKPDWTDPSGLLGYFDVLSGTYLAPPFLRSLLTATSEPRAAVFVILDEMNLARVEYYLADVLSAIETGLPLHLHDRQDDLITSDGITIPRQIAWPTNVYLVGTINVDETTHAISDKVLDRAVLIDLSEVDFEACFSAIAARHPEAATVVERCKQVLSGLHECLSPHGLAFGYRVANEVCAYVLFATQGTHDTSSVDAALDEQLVQKILPKLRGNENQRQMLEKIQGTLSSLSSAGFTRTQQKLTRLVDDLTEYGSFHASR